MISVTTQFKEEQIEINGKVYTVREFDGTVREKYVEFITANTERNEDGTAKDTKLEMVQATLISLCLFDTENKPAFTPQEINKWPAKAIDSVYAVADRLNVISQVAQDKAKNDSGVNA